MFLVCEQVSVSLLCRVTEREKGAKGEGHNALGKRDEICGVRW